MRAFSEPSACPQNIYGSGSKKCLKSELLAANVARSPHLTGAYSLRNRAFNACSLRIDFSKLSRVLSLSCLSKSLIGLFTGSQKQDTGSAFRALIMQRTGLAVLA